MKTAAWSLALAAGAGSVAATAPPAGYSSWGNGSPAGYSSWGSNDGSWGSTDSSSSTKSTSTSSIVTNPVTTSTTSGWTHTSPYTTHTTDSSTLTSPVTTSTTNTSPYTWGPSGSPPASYPVTSGIYGNHSTPTGPSCTTTYISQCTETSTLIFRTGTAYSLTTIDHTLTTTYAGSCSATSPATSPETSPATAPETYPATWTAPTPSGPKTTETAPPNYPPTSPVGPVTPSGPTLVVTHTTTVSTTICPITETYVSDGTTLSSVTLGTSTVIQTIPVYPTQSNHYGSYGGPHGGAPSPPVSPVAEPSRTPGEVYVTQTTIVSTTLCPGETKPFTWGSWTSSYTKYSTSTVTTVLTTTVTHPTGGPTGGAGNGGGYGGSSTEVCTETATLTDGGSTSYSTYVTTRTHPTGGPGGYTSAPYPTGGPTNPGGPTGGSGYAHPTSYFPAGNNTSHYLPTATTGRSTPTSTCSKPTSTKCVPCEGQSGTPENYCGLDINTNWYDEMPKTCKTVEYTWTITNETISPDGVARPAFVVNGQMPGPMIKASWGDTVIIHLTNNLPADGRNGTTIHFHGIRQNRTNEYDGVSSITQCPLAPGESMTYTWEASSYGTSWWHAHYALQTYDGLFGPIVIDGPSSAEYDEDQVVMMQDWSYATADSIYGYTQQVASGQRANPTLDTGLINGMNVGLQGGGQRFEMTVTKGKKYRFRLTNTAIQATFNFYIDSHKLTVIAVDFVPITPYTTDKVAINIGQRYDVIVEFDQDVADYWLRADNQQPCGPVINTDIRGIIHYAGGPGSTPADNPGLQYPPSCLDEPYENIKPIVPWSAGAQTTEVDEVIAIGPGTGAAQNLFKWTLSGTTFYSEWSNPTLESIVENGTIPDTSGNLAISVPNLGEWVYIVITSPIPVPHPIHLHGHDFLILAQGLGTYDSSVALNLENPPRRDVAQMPADPPTGQTGYLVVAFYTHNPGVWLMHCHIGWHNAMGFALQIIENLDGIKETVGNTCQMEDVCKSWRAYADSLSPVVTTDDSGV